MNLSLRKRIAITACIGLWVLALAAGVTSLLRYENAAGTSGNAPKSWPASSQISLSPDRFTLVMLVHPRCPCTRASISELAQVMAHVHGKLKAYVLYLSPRNTSADWSDTRMLRSAAQIPGVAIVQDFDGTQARQFGAQTSGETVLFDGTGRCVFHGGITGSRGHVGDNAGESAVVSLVNNLATPLNRTSVFGCSLIGHQEREACRK